MRVHLQPLLLIVFIISNLFTVFPAFAWNITPTEKEPRQKPSPSHSPTKSFAPTFPQLHNTNINQNTNVQNQNSNISIQNNNNPNFTNSNSIEINNNANPPSRLIPLAVQPLAVAPAVQAIQLPQTGASSTIPIIIVGLLPLGLFVRAYSENV